MSSHRGFGFSGFQMPSKSKRSNNAVPPPPSCGVSKQGYSTMNAISQNALSASWGSSRKRAKTEDEYFEKDDDDGFSGTPALAYIPAPGSPTHNSGSKPADEEEDDPLDAFMAGIEKQVRTENAAPGAGPSGVRGDIEEEDVEESYYRYMEENPTAGLVAEDEEDPLEYDEDGNPIAPTGKKIIDPLPPIDHSLIEYAPFEKNFYTVHEEIAGLTNQQVNDLRKALGIKVSGASPPRPVSSFAHLGLDDALLKAIIKAEYTQPTPIQAQAVPAALAGRDVLGIAQTGSGKTAAFLWPLLIHIMDQPELQEGDGPIGLILAPTRELAQQIYVEARKFGKVYNVQVVCAYGGGSKWEQSKALQVGAEIVVATPGRIIDLVKMGATNLKRVTFLVLDEADRMFELGFEPQVRSVCNHVRPDRQTLLFSATFRKRIEKLARDALTDPVRVTQGDIGEACVDVTQHVLVLGNPQEKKSWLCDHLVQFLSTGSVLVFVTRIADAELLAADLKVHEYPCLLLHGDMEQAERNKVITQFKRRELELLVATDVAARGLDIPHVRTVVNYDPARDIDTHTHRVGRTGRAGNLGDAFTLLLEKDKEFAGHIVRNLEGVGQEVPQCLLDLALRSSWFRKSRFKGGKGKNINIGGCGLGFKERGGRAASYTAPSCIEAAQTVASSMQSASPRAGPATDRLAAMKAAFKNQYMTQFTASTDAPPPMAHSLPPPPPPPPPKRAKKSRWE